MILTAMQMKIFGFCLIDTYQTFSNVFWRFAIDVNLQPGGCCCDTFCWDLWPGGVVTRLTTNQKGKSLILGQMFQM